MKKREGHSADRKARSRPHRSSERRKQNHGGKEKRRGTRVHLRADAEKKRGEGVTKGLGHNTTRTKNLTNNRVNNTTKRNESKGEGPPCCLQRGRGRQVSCPIQYGWKGKGSDYEGEGKEVNIHHHMIAKDRRKRGRTRSGRLSHLQMVPRKVWQQKKRGVGENSCTCTTVTSKKEEKKKKSRPTSAAF